MDFPLKNSTQLFSKETCRSRRGIQLNVSDISSIYRDKNLPQVS